MVNTPPGHYCLQRRRTGDFSAEIGDMKKGLPPGKPLISATFEAVRPDVCCIKITKKIEHITTKTVSQYHADAKRAKGCTIILRCCGI